MVKGFGRYLGALLTLALLILAVPQKVSAFVEPGREGFVWQMAAAVLIFFMFYVGRVAGFVRSRFSLSTPRAMGFLAASVFGAAVSPLTMRVFGGHPLPRFNDVFLVGIVLTAYLFTWESAAYLLAISVLVSAWVLPPNGTFWVEGFSEWYRLTSFTLIGIFLIMIITRIKTRYSQPIVETQPECEEQPARARSVAAGD